MQIQNHEISNWPSLAWICKLTLNNQSIELFHGSEVEIRDGWFCEAVWDGNFSEGNFDQTDIISGSGGRIRDDHLKFVSSGSTLDRLQQLQIYDQIWVSNSLPCLLAMTQATVKTGYGNYFNDFGKIVDGLKSHRHELKTSRGTVQFTYFDNLVWNGNSLTEFEKPNNDYKLNCFEDYFHLLKEKFSALASNLSDSNRQIKYEFLGTLSSGYDSTMVTTLASNFGCRHAISFFKAHGEEDHGSVAAQVLKINLSLFDRNKWSEKGKEYLFITADAKAEDRYFVEAEPILKNKVLLTGYHGDKMWDKKTKDLSANIVRGDRSGLSLSEYRLHTGFINCPVPFWFSRQIQAINEISNSSEMKRWDIESTYSRPICRRIAEEAGIPREAFGMKKRMSSEQAFTSTAFLSPALMQDYLSWLKKNRLQLIIQDKFPLIVSPLLDNLLCRLINSIPKIVKSFLAYLSKIPVLWRFSNNKYLYQLTMLDIMAEPMYLRKYIFPWALERAKSHYPIPVILKSE